ncbi:hypothetical protein RZE82_06460 [Mollicutes bacterium LVI A0039]|nr:hypothetical protein RZE82_06460 [Mollicutes bacterium LVI A0039]
MVLYYFEMTVILTVFNVICNMLPYVVITYYLILIFKQLKNIYDFEKQQLSDQYSEFWNGNKKESVNLVLLSHSSNKYIDDYLLICDSEEMWKSSEYNVLNYNYMCIQLFKLYSLVTLINCILFFIGGNIYDSGNYTLLQARLSMRACVIITGSLITIFCLNWLFNQEIILSFKNKQKLTAQSFTMFILSVVIGVMGIGILITSMLDNSYKYQSEYEYSYKEFKSSFVHKVEVNRDYLNYNDYDKLYYIFSYPQYFTDDAKILGYNDNFVEKSNVNRYKLSTKVYDSEFIEFANNYYGEEYSYSLVISKRNFPYVWLNIDENNDPNNFAFVKVNLNEENRQDFGDEFKSEEDEKLGLLMKEEALKITNSLWDEEMKDRGLI